MPKPITKPDPTPNAFSTANLHAPAANTAAIVTYAAISGQYHSLEQITCGYSATPTGGNLKIEDGSGTVVFSCDISAAGPTVFSFPRGIRGSANTALIITLAAGGSGITGKVNVQGKRTQTNV